MPSFKIAGKSKEDLAVVAHLAGLLTAEEAGRLTRTELVRLLEKENRKTEVISKPSEPESTASSDADAAPVRGKRSGRAKKMPVDATPAEPSVPVEAVRTRPIRTRKVASAQASASAVESLPQPILVPAEPEVRTRARKAGSIAKIRKLPDQPAATATIDSHPAPATVQPVSEVPVPAAMPELAVSPIPEIPDSQTEKKKPKPRSKKHLEIAATDEISATTPVAVPIEAKVTAPAQESAPSQEISEKPAPVDESPAPIMMPTETAAPETAAASSESVEPVRRPRGRRKAERPETVIQSEEAPAAGESQAAKPEPGPRVGRPAGRKPRQPKDAAGEQMQLLPADQAISDQVNRDAKPTAVQEANLTAEQEMAAERSPEAAEAASDQDSTQETADLHRVPPHHTLMPNRPVQRRTRMIGNPEDTGSQPSAESMPTRQPAFGRQQQMPGRGPGRPARPASSGSRPISESSRPNNRPYQPAGSQEPAMLSDTRMGGAESIADESEADAMATTMPVQPENESEAAKMHRPIVETGDVQAGVLEIMPDGYGFLRKENYLQGNKDIYVPPQYIRRFGLRPGDFISGPVKLQRESDRYQALLYIKDVNGMAPEKMLRRPHFDRLTPIYPDNRFILETVRTELSTRIIDLVAPIGKGQRGMIVSPPKAGKTILLQKIANAISINNPDVKLIVLLIDERPEEVTDMQRSINGEVVYSTFDKTPENHTKVTELVLERAMRLVELKQDVVILLDSMTRLARAYNLTINPTGRTLSGGLDPGALYGPKRFFGAARNIEDGGSLTIIATSLIETGSRMDEVIFEEFKGTGNMEVYLDRKMSEKRIFPAIDINKSGTRREELLMTSKELDAVWTIRKAFSQLENTAVTEAIINLLLKTKNNEHFIASVNVSFNDKNVFEAMRGVRPDAAQNQGQGQGQAGRAGGSGFGSGTGYGGGGYNSNYRRQQTNDDD